MNSTATKTENVTELMHEIGRRARVAASQIAIASAKEKRHAINAAAGFIRDRKADILAANELDVAAAIEAKLSDALIDRLKLDVSRIESMAAGLEAITTLEDPVGAIIDAWDRPNGLQIERVRTPLGVIGVIYESRPNVTADAGALCLMSGNAVILRGGSDSVHSSAAIHDCLLAGLEAAGLPADCVQRVPTTDRAAVGEMLSGLDGNVDVIVPRGGKGLVQRVQENCRVPVFAHLEGICHIYVDATADVAMAVEVVRNAKMRRTGVCGAAETLLIQSAAIDTHLKPILTALTEAGCEIRGDKTVCDSFTNATPASDADWDTEYLSPIISVRCVDDVDAAIAHIRRHSSGHTESVLSDDPVAVEKFLCEVDSAIVMHNASTQFADGGEFGMGAEIGIATGKMHARGPVGVEQLCSFKYRVRGSGQVRP